MKYWYETLAVAQRILIELGRRRRSLVLWSIFPVSILLINGLILKERANLTTAKAFETAAPASLVLEFRLSRSKSAIAVRLANSSQERQWSLATSYQAQP